MTPSPMTTVISHSPEETSALGEAWGRTAAAGLVIGLTGDLGAGKTQLVKGLARGLGVMARVQSPTFALVHEYTGGRLPLYHLDFYRLEQERELTGIGLDDYLDARGILAIEWADKFPGALPTHTRWLHFHLGESDTRAITDG